MAAHSYQGQDLFVLDVLGNQRDGFFLDSGASDGVSGSNTLLLESQFGWSGICIEPNEAAYAKLVAARRCHCVNTCLYDREGPVDFLEAAGVLGGIMSEYEAGLLRDAQTLAQEGGREVRPVIKEAKTVRSVLREYDAPSVIDYWSLDTEGSELSILRSFPFDEYTVRVLTVEHNLSPARQEIRRFLEYQGYVYARSLGIDDAYVIAPVHRSSAWRSRVWGLSRHHGMPRR